MPKNTISNFKVKKDESMNSIVYTSHIILTNFFNPLSIDYLSYQK